MRVKTKKRIGILSDVIAAIGLIAVFAVMLTGSSKNLSKIDPANAALASVSTNAASGITTTAADLNGNLNSTDSAVTAEGFEWGTTVGYGNTVNITPPASPVPEYSSKFGGPGVTNGLFGSIAGVAKDSTGKIYAADGVNNRIQVFDGSGNYLSQFPIIGAGFPTNFITGIYIDSSDNIFAADTFNHKIQKYNSAGVFQFEFGVFGAAPGQLWAPANVSTDSIGNIYVADPTNGNLQKFDSGGTFITQIGTGGGGAGNYLAPNDVEIDAFDNIFVLDFSGNKVLKYDSAGVFQFEFSGGFYQPQYFTLDSSGNIYVSDSDNSVVKYFDSAGNPLGQFGSNGSGNGQFTQTMGITIVGDYIYVGDTGGSRIQIFYTKPYPVGAFTYNLGSLTCGTTYHYRAFATNTDGTAYGADQSFTTSACPIDMVLQTDPATLIGETSAKLNGTIVSSGSPVVARGFEYGTTTSYGQSVFDPTPVGFSPGPYGLPVNLLQCNTTYHFRAVAQNTTNTYYGNDLTFTTLSCSPDMTIQTNPASGIGNNDATLNGDILSTKSTITSRGFQWGTSTTYTNTITDGAPNIMAYSFISKFGSSGSNPGEFDSDPDVAVDKFGNIFVTDVGNERVQKFNSNGVFQLEFGSFGSNPGEFDNVLAIRTDSNGDVFVVDRYNYRVQKFNNNGAFITSFGSQGSGTGQFEIMQGISIDNNDNLYISDTSNNNVQKFDNNGNYLLTIGGLPYGDADGQFYAPIYSAVDSANNVYVVDQMNNRIQKFDDNGNFISKFGSFGEENGQFNMPVAIALDSNDNIFVADTYAYAIKQFDKDFNYLSRFGTFGTGNGQFGFLQGIFTYLGNDRLYQADLSNDRVQIFGQIPGFSIGPYSMPISGLSDCTTYHYRAFGTNQTGTFYGDDVSFTTTGCPTPPPPTPPVPPTPPTPPGPGPITPTTPTTPGTTPLTPPTTTGAGIIPGVSNTTPSNPPSEPNSPLIKTLRSLPRGLSVSIPYFLLLLLLILAILYAIQSYREYRSIQRFNMLLSRYHNLQFGSRNFVALTNHYLGTPLGILQFSSELLVTAKLFSKETAQNVATAIQDIKDKVHELLTESGKATAQSMENINPKLANSTVNRSILNPSVWVPLLIAAALLIATDLLFIYAKVYQLNLASLAVQIGLFALCALLIILAFRSYVRNRFIRKQRSELLKSEQQLMDEKMNFVHKTTESLKSDIEKLKLAGKDLPKNTQTKPFMRGLTMLVSVEKSFELMQEFSTISPFESISASETQGVVDEVINRHTEQIKAKNITVHKDITNDMNMGLSKSALIILLGSTINNAVKFSKDGGNVIVTAKNSIDGTKISISDDGVGIDKSKLDELMEPFNRATDAMKYDYEGIGLGLYLDRIIMEQIGGKISIASNPGHGTTIEMRIPRGRVLENPEPLKNINTEGTNVFTPKTV